MKPAKYSKSEHYRLVSYAAKGFTSRATAERLKRPHAGLRFYAMKHQIRFGNK